MNIKNLNIELIVIDHVVDPFKEVYSPATLVEPGSQFLDKLTALKRFGIVDIWNIRKRLG